MAKCDCYYQHGMKFVCYGTKEMEECNCGGDVSKCDFYPEKRKTKTQKMANEKRLIDANALDRVLEDFENRYSKSCFVLSAKAIANARQIVYAMKTVDAVKHGQWKDAYDGDGYVCSVCGDDFCVMFNETERFNYCPNCGAKMDGDGNG